MIDQHQIDAAFEEECKAGVIPPEFTDYPIAKPAFESGYRAGFNARDAAAHQALTDENKPITATPERETEGRAK